jgi:hypothetical protein
MTLPKHTRNQSGEYRQANGNERARNLAKDYPEFRHVHPETKLSTLRERFDVTSINAVRAELRKRQSR